MSPAFLGRRGERLEIKIAQTHSEAMLAGLNPGWGAGRWYQEVQKTRSQEEEH
jgi:hypothetical protein